jgi:hypothetical protein
MNSGYGFENIYLDYAGLSRKTPFIPNYDHGWSFEDVPSKNSTLKHLSNTHLAWNSRVCNNLRSKTSKKIFITGAPFLLWKKANFIKKDTKKKSLFFPSHSTSKISQDIGPIEIHKIISKLDPFLKPIDICLHWQDYVKEKNIYERLGYNVFTAGGIFSDKFLPNFYNILQNYEFTLSNKLGTYILYSIDLGIPFSLVGREPNYFNHSSDKNKSLNYKISDYKYGKKVIGIFNGIHTKINLEQKKIVEEECGSKNIINSDKLKKIILEELSDSFKSSKGFAALSKQLIKSYYIQFFK